MKLKIFGLEIRLSIVAAVFLSLSLILASAIFFVAKPTGRKCTEEELSIFTSSTRYISCIDDSAGNLWYEVNKVFPANASPIFSEATIKADKFKYGLNFYYMSTSLAPLVVRFEDTKKEASWPVGTTLDSTRGVYKGSFTKKDLDRGISFYPHKHQGMSVLLKFTAGTEKNPVNVAYTPKSPSDAGESHIFINLLMVLLAVSALLCVAQYHFSKRIIWGVAALSVFFGLSVLNFERPFRGMGGYLDKGDDSHYFAYAQAHLADNDMFTCKTDVHFSNVKNMGCFNLPGTSAMLELGIFARSLFTKDSFKGSITIAKLRAMRAVSAFYGFLATLFMFFALHVLFPSFWAPLLSSFLIWGTSLSKFAFVRSIFSHSSEVFLVCVAVWTLVCVHNKKMNLALGSLMLGILTGLQLNIRGEMIAAIPLWFVLLPFLKFQLDKRIDFKLLIPSGLFLIGVSPFLAIYKYVSFKIGNYTSSPTKYFLFKKVSDFFNVELWLSWFKQAMVVMNSIVNSGGVIICFALIVFILNILLRKKLSWLEGASILFMLGFFFLMTSFGSPLGYEWQHRYFLKLYPFGIILLYMGIQKYGSIFSTVLMFVFSVGSYLQWKAYDGHYASPVVRNELMKNILSDMHVQFNGYLHGFYLNYQLALVILFVCFGLLIMGPLKRMTIDFIKR